MVGRHPVGRRAWHAGAGAALLTACFVACGAAARQASVDPRAHPAERFVVGRVRIFRGGDPFRVTRPTSGLGSLFAPGPLTTLTLCNLASQELFDIPIENEEGWFAAQLPAGSYAIAMRYDIWVFGVPARVEVPADPPRCYLGTLGVNLFARASVAGTWARAFGGAIPTDDIEGAVADQRDAAAAHAGMALPACLIRPEDTPANEIRRPPPPDGGGSR
jgi:hypothetical protein